MAGSTGKPCDLLHADNPTIMNVKTLMYLIMAIKLHCNISK